MRTADWTAAVSVLDRVTAVLDAFGDDDGLGVSEIARRANLPKSTVSRIAADLVRQRYLDRDGTTLHLGLRLFELGQAVERPMLLRRLAYPIMVRLRNLTGESVRLAVLDGQNVVLIASIAGQADTGNQAVPGARFPAHASALGQAMLAYSTDEVQQTAASSAPATLPGDLVEVRRAGVASNYEGAVTGVVCVASPIRVEGKPPAGAIAVAGPAGAIDARRVGGLVRSAATALGRQLSTHAPS